MAGKKFIDDSKHDQFVDKAWKDYQKAQAKQGKPAKKTVKKTAAKKRK